MWLAADDVLVRPVAVKILHPELAGDNHFLRRFRAEARTAASLRHPHVMGVYDWGYGEEGPYLVMEHLEGGSLRGLLAAGYRCTPAQTLLIGLEAARGLAHAHRRGVVHRDIKPANLLFAEDTRVCVGDFGLARAVAEASNSSAGGIEGTIRYTSPEQAQGHRLDGKSDVYSLGLCLLEAATGHVPFEADSTAGTLAARIGNQLVTPATMGPLGRVIEAACRPETAERLDAQGLTRALHSVASHYDPPERLPLRRLGLVHQCRADELLAEGTAEFSAPLAAPDGEEPPSERPVLRKDDTVMVQDHGDSSPIARPNLAALSDDVALPSPGRRLPSWEDHDVTVAAGPNTVTAMPLGAHPENPGHGAIPSFYHEGQVGDIENPEDVEAVEHGSCAKTDKKSEEENSTRGESRRPLVIGAVLVLLAVLAASLLWFRPWLPMREVAKVDGQAEPEALTRLNSEGWKVVLRRRASENVPIGTVIDSQPARARQGSRVEVVVSSGPEPRTIAVWAGKPLEEVKRVLAQSGLVVSEQRTYDDKAQAGSVLGTDPPAGAQVQRGATVTVLVSDGPTPVQVPDVARKTPEDAQAALETAGFAVERKEVYSDEVGTGKAVGTDPAAGAQVQPGGAVKLHISKGPETVAVPAVAGKTPTQAEALLRNAGLRVSGLNGPPSGTVKGSNPPAGARVKRGSAVTLTTG